MHKLDIIIFGAGIAGLWTLARLRQQGYNAILLENTAIGAGQTIKSQGIIHGGLKYALTGQLNAAATSLHDMPTLWQQCLQGTGEIDLSAVKILAAGQYMWSANKVTGGVATLFASSALKSLVTAVPKASWPTAIKNATIASKLYQLQEPVLDVPSLLQAIATPLLPYCFKVAADYQLTLDNNNHIKSVTIASGATKLQLHAQQYIFTAGNGNELLIKNLANAPAMQRRPLQMVMVKSKNLLPVFGHCIGLAAVPRITITTHTANDGTPVWYLGGKIAEEGIHKSSAELIDFTKQELSSLFPNIDLGNATYATFLVDRAEAKQANGAKPNSTTMFSSHNYITAWPTKLAFAPLLAQQILDKLQQDNIVPQFTTSNLQQYNLLAPNIALPIWDQLL